MKYPESFVERIKITFPDNVELQMKAQVGSIKLEEDLFNILYNSPDNYKEVKKLYLECAIYLLER